MRKSSFLVGICALTLVLNSCGGESENPDSTPVVQGEPIETTPDQGTDSKAALEAGSYCYRTEEKTIQAIAEILVEPSQAVSGTLDATITNDAEGYYTSYNQAFAGVLKDGDLNASITTKIENDVQKSQETWKLDQNRLSDGKNVSLKRVDCEEIIALKANRKAESAPIAQTPQSKPVPKSQAPQSVPPRSKPVPIPQASPPPSKPASAASRSPIRVQFPQGGTETTLDGNLNSGQSQVYRLSASKGQDMHVQISTKSGAANFDVEVAGGEVIEQQLTDYLDFTLPVGGEYVITVHGDAAATSYSLNIKVQ